MPFATAETSVLNKHVGKRFGNLVVIGVVKSREPHTKGFHLLLKCDCGKAWESREAAIRLGQTQRCSDCAAINIANRSTTHGMFRGGAKHPDYGVWIEMRRRCDRPANINYQHYGGRGIKVCERWNGRDGFPNFVTDMGPRLSRKYSIERKDNNGDYEPSNCYWATDLEQNRNKRGVRKLIYKGRQMCGTELADAISVPDNFVYGCIDMGLNGDQIAELASIACNM